MTAGAANRPRPGSGTGWTTAGLVTLGVLLGGCGETQLDGLSREARLQVRDFALAACHLGVLEAVRIAPASPGDTPGGDPRIEPTRTALRDAEEALPGRVPADFRAQVRARSYQYGRGLWRERLADRVAENALAPGCAERADAQFLSFRAYRRFDASGEIEAVAEASDGELRASAERRWAEAAALRVPPARLAGQWGEQSGCHEGRRYAFAEGELRMDPLAGPGGGPPEYLPMRLAIDTYRVGDGEVEIVASNGERIEVAITDGNRLLVRPVTQVDSAFCRAIAATGVLHRCS